jgi:hypothetical protein
VDPDTFLPVDDDHRGRAIVLVAARVAATRLIDNEAIFLRASTPERRRRQTWGEPQFVGAHTHDRPDRTRSSEEELSEQTRVRLGKRERLISSRRRGSSRRLPITTTIPAAG